MKISESLKREGIARLPFENVSQETIWKIRNVLVGIRK